MAAMISYDVTVTSCTEEPLWQVVVPGILVPVSRSNKPCACSHQEARSSWQLIRSSDKYWSNSAFMHQLPSSVIYTGIHFQLTRHEVWCQNSSKDWILYASQRLLTILRWSRWLLWPGALSCHHFWSQQQMCTCLNWSKIYVSSSTIGWY